MRSLKLLRFSGPVETSARALEAARKLRLSASELHDRGSSRGTTWIEVVVPNAGASADTGDQQVQSLERIIARSAPGFVLREYLIVVDRGKAE